MIAIALAAALLAAGPTAPDLRAPPPPELESTIPLGGGVRTLERGPFGAGELVGAGLGTLAGDALVLGLAYGTYELFVSGTVYPSVENFRRAAYGLGAAALLLPPLGAVIGGSLARVGPLEGARWKAFLLSLVGHAAALMVGYLAAPSYWAVLPVQLATMSPGTSFGLHWGGRTRPSSPVEPEVRAPRRAAAAAPVAFQGAPVCPDPGA